MPRTKQASRPADDPGTGHAVEVTLRAGALAADGVSAVALPVTPGPDGPSVEVGDGAAAGLGVDVTGALARQRVDGKPGDVLALPVETGALRTVYLYGVGAGDPAAYRKAGAALVRRAKDEEALALPLPDDGGFGASAAALVEALALASYRFRIGAADGGPRLARVELVTEAADAVRTAFDRVRAVTRAVLRARDLTNTPSLVKTPAWLADQGVALAEQGGLEVRIRDEAELAAEGFGGVLAVGMGSARPPRLIEVSWRPRGARRHVVLIGKGITFDSGGLSLKPNDGMVAMKTDMAGGAAVLATMSALRDLGVRVRVTGLVPAAENLPSGTAQRPGDVIRQYGGRTVEVLNTDAEGRLVLADALAYAVARLRPDALVDLATLTGAASLGLGRRHAALYATDDALAAELEAAAVMAGERVWRMPLVDDYRWALDSPVADLAHVARDKRVSAGSIVAALFLREFTGGRPWAHLDIAGPARAEADENDVTKGATGFGVRLLLGWLTGQT